MKIILVIATFLIVTLLFKKAAGTLSLKYINIVGFAYYSIVIFDLIGASLIFLGFRDHYIVQKITDDYVIVNTYYILIYTAIALPVSICIFNKMFYGKNIKISYLKYIKNKIEISREKSIFSITVLLSIVCFISIIYVFYYIGYIPIFKLLQSGFDSASARYLNARAFTGNEYIKNFIALGLTPLLSYLAYIYCRTTKNKRWKYLFVVLFVLSIFVKTYDFEKSPIIYYLFYFYIIEVLLGNVVSLKQFFPLLLIFVFVIITEYIVIGNYSGNWISLTNGPVSRTLMTQVGTLFLHIQSFPKYIPFLHGKSLPSFITFFLGIDESWVRSGRKVMEIYNPAGVKNNIAGVMNTIFVGEAYANWGIVGVIISPILVGIVFSSAYTFLLKQKKTPLLLVVYIELFISFTTALQGGFMDFIYNSSVLVLLSIFTFISVVSKNGKITIRKKH